MIIFLSRQISKTGYKFNRSTGELNKLSVVHFKGSAQLTQFPPLLNLNCTEPYLGPLYRSYVIIQILNCKIPARVLLSGAICKRFSKVSHRWRCAACHLLQVFTYKNGRIVHYWKDTITSKILAFLWTEHENRKILAWCFPLGLFSRSLLSVVQS